MSESNPRERVYQISTNRTHARHKVRYVESSAPPEGECRLCVGTLPERKSFEQKTSEQFASDPKMSSAVE